MERRRAPSKSRARGATGRIALGSDAGSADSPLVSVLPRAFDRRVACDRSRAVRRVVALMRRLGRSLLGVNVSAGFEPRSRASDATTKLHHVALGQPSATGSAN